MAAEKLYYQDVFMREFQGTVTRCEPWKGGFRVALDRTAFYPEGGGQPWDTGTLGEAAVQEVHEKEGEVWHYTDRPLEVGSAVTGRIDWERRFDLMQQHSGEHLVSGLVHARFGYDNVGFHMGEAVITMDFNGEIRPEELAEIEAQANARVWEDRETHIFYPDEEERKQLPYRSKKELTGLVRLVEFPGTDLCACCGLHVARTGQIGLIKLLSVQKFREGVRVEMISGGRALAHVNQLEEQNHRISVQLSAKPGETAAAVARLGEENFALRGRIMELEERLFSQKAAECRGAGNVLLFEEGLEPDGVRKLAAAVMETCGGLCAVFSGADGAGYKYALGQKDGNLRELCQEMNRQLSGRGGGKPFFVQGSVSASRREIEAFWAQALPDGGR